MPQILGKDYKFFSNDIYSDLMPKLIKAGLVPMNMADVMRARLESVKCNNPKQKEFWLDNYFNTAEGVAYYKDKVKIIYNAQALREVDPDTESDRRGALILTPKKYKTLEGPEFLRSDLKKRGVNKMITKSEVKSNPVWRALTRDNHLLSEYADLIFAEVKQRYSFTYAMSVYLDSKQENPMMRNWSVNTLSSGSDANGIVCLFHPARLVGVRAESASKKETLDEKIIDALKA